MRNRWSAGVLMAVVAVGCGGNRTGEEVERRAALEVEVAPGTRSPLPFSGPRRHREAWQSSTSPQIRRHAGTWPCRRGRGRSRR